MIHVNAVEAVWIASNLLGVVFTIAALGDAWADEKAIRALNGRARELVGRGNIRREAFRLAVQVILLVVVVPGLFSDREINLSLPVAALMAVPFVILASSVLDWGERRRLARMLDADIATERRRRDDP